PSGSRAVMMARLASLSISVEVSTSCSLTLPARAALAKPGPIDSATCNTVTGASKLRLLPSGSVIVTMHVSTLFILVDLAFTTHNDPLHAPAREWGKLHCGSGRHDQIRTGDLYHVKVAL